MTHVQKKYFMEIINKPEIDSCSGFYLFGSSFGLPEQNALEIAEELQHSRGGGKGC